MNTVAAPQTPFLRAAPNLQRLPPPIRSDRVRLVKDVLRVGKWFVGNDANGQPQYVTFTDADLEALATRFHDHLMAGIAHPLCWGHTEGKPDVSAKDVIAEIAHCWAENERLWIGVYLTDPIAAELLDKNLPCSIGLWSDWRDGTGKVWEGQSLIHVGVVAHAVIPDQQPFIEMAASPPTGKSSMTFDVIKEAVNTLLEAVKPGTSLPESVTEENIDEMLPALIAVIVGKPEEPAPEDAPVVGDAATGDTNPASDMPLEMAAAFSQFVKRFEALEQRLAAKETATAEQSYRDACAALGTQGVPADKIEGLLEMGSKLSWDQKHLAMFADFNGKKLELGSKLGTSREARPNYPMKLTPEDIETAKAELAKRLPGGGRKAKAAK